MRSRSLNFVAAGVCLSFAAGCAGKTLSFTDGSSGGRGGAANVDCPASPDWLSASAPPSFVMPAPHPATECPFYQAAWQSFLVATRASQTTPQSMTAADSAVTFTAYPGVDDLFTSSQPRPAARARLDSVKQPGRREILIDQNGRPIYYGSYVNHAFQAFVAENELTTAADIQNADPELSFPPGVAELRAAWQVVDSASVPANYITTTTTVPTLSQDSKTHAIVEDRNTPRVVRVALLALHVAFTLPGHPEFIWSTFEHVDENGDPDTAPTIANNAPADDPSNSAVLGGVSNSSYSLYRARTPANQANVPFIESALSLDFGSQSFPGQQTSVYRMFPASKSNTVFPEPALTALNASVAALFDPADQRKSYRLIGALWLDRPEFFSVDRSLQNDFSTSSPLFQGLFQGPDQQAAIDSLAANGTSSPFSILGGEDRLSGAVLQSFTQAGSFHNCLACHDTRATTPAGVSSSDIYPAPLVLGPKRFGVSHIFSQFLMDENPTP